MYKDFDDWNEKKKQIEYQQENFYFRVGEIWWCAVGINVGIESCGKGRYYQRPILILKKLSTISCIGIPLSTQPKTGSWFIDIKVDGVKRWALLYQIRMFSTNRFQRHLSTIEHNDFIRVKAKLEQLLEF